MDVATIVEVVSQLTDVLVHYHRAGFVYRDLRPAQITFRTTNPIDVVLMQSDISTSAREFDSINSTLSGSPKYLPPEYLLLNAVSESGDWWSLGVTVLELASGEHPFEGLDHSDITHHFVAGRPLEVTIVSPPRLQNLCRGLLIRDPALRWDGGEVIRWLAGEDPAIGPW